MKTVVEEGFEGHARAKFGRPPLCGKALTTRFLKLAILSLFAIWHFAGCKSLRKYALDRALDFTDIVDIKHPKTLSGYGLHARVEVTDWLATGMGVGLGYDTVEWYGRRKLYPYFFDHCLRLITCWKEKNSTPSFISS